MSRILISLTFLLFSNIVYSQEASIFISHESAFFYERELYNTKNKNHTAFKPVLFSEINYKKVDSSLKISNKRSFFNKIVNENLFETQNKELNFIINPIFSSLPAQNTSNSQAVSLFEGGLSLAANYKNKLSLQTNFSVNAHTLPSFYEKNLSIIPHYGKNFDTKDKTYYYALFNARLSYSPSKYFNLQTGYGKNFIGDGYRSLFLSQNANSYPFFKATATFWKLKYQLIHASLKHIEDYNSRIDLPNKWSVIHYISLNLGKRLSLGLFETIISNPKDSIAQRGFEVNYLNPLIFFRPMEYTIGSPDNVILGFSLKLRLFENLHLYSQIVVDEFDFTQLKKLNGYWANKFGIQVGFKSFNAFKINDLFLQGEVNIVRPYTYSHGYPILNYGHFYEPMAHPYGGNFYEAVGIINYSFKKRFSVKLKSIYTLIGTDENEIYSVGQNIFRSYARHENQYNNETAQGLKTNILFNELSASYLINPKWNMEGILQITNYYIQNSVSTETFNIISLGIRSNIFPKVNSNIKID